MSYLDKVWEQAAGVDPDVMAGISTALTTQGAQLLVQQAKVATLESASAAATAQLLALAGVDTAEQLATAAAQAAADAAAAVNTSQASSLVSLNALALGLIQRIVWGIGLDVRQYTPLDSNGFHVALTNSNFQDALEAAIADAYSRIPSTTPAGVEITGAYYVSIPEGYWTVTRQIRFPGTHYVKQTPGIRGAGMGRTTLIPAPGFDATYDSLLYAGSAADADTSYTKDWHCGSLTIQGNGHGCNGIHVQTAYGAQIEYVRVTNFQRAGLSPRLGWGFYFDDAYEDTTGTRPNQHVTIFNCWSERNQGGAYARDGGPFNFINLYCNQNYWRDAIVDQARVHWHGGNLQSTGYSPNSYWYGNNPNGSANIALGWNHIVKHGSGATLQAASGGRCGVIGLTGIDNGSGTDRFKWLELRRTVNPYAPDDQISGMYLIDELYNDTALWIRKTTTHAETSGLDWWVRDSAASDIVLTGEVYHEGAVPSLVLVNKVWDGHGDPSVTIDGVIVANAAAVIESRAYDTTLRLAAIRQANGLWVIASHALQITALEARPNAFQLDEYSREGLVCRAAAPNPFTEPGTDAFDSIGHMYMGSTRVSRRMVSLANECGAVAILDPRIASSLTLSGTDITAWASRVNGLSAVPFVSGNFSTYIASDPVFGTPSVQLTASAAGANKGLALLIPAAKLPSIKHQMSVVVVYRTPDATPAPTGQQRRILLSSASAAHAAGFNEADHAGPVCYGGVGSSDPGAFVFTAPGTPDALAHCAVFGSAGRMRLCLDTDQTRVRAVGWEEYDAPGGLAWPVADHTLYLNTAAPSVATQTLIVAFIAVIPRGLCWQERQQFIDAAAAEFKIANR